MIKTSFGEILRTAKILLQKYGGKDYKELSFPEIIDRARMRMKLKIFLAQNGINAFYPISDRELFILTQGLK